MPGTPIEWTDRCALFDEEHEGGGAGPKQEESHDFARYYDRIADLTPRPQEIPAGMHPFPTKYVSRSSSLTFNVADYSRQLMNDFLIAGGVIETREFHSPQEVAMVPQKLIVNCTGYGARQLWSDGASFRCGARSRG